MIGNPLPDLLRIFEAHTQLKAHRVQDVLNLANHPRSEPDVDKILFGELNKSSHCLDICVLQTITSTDAEFISSA
jgi:hypothetical protein